MLTDTTFDELLNKNCWWTSELWNKNSKHGTFWWFMRFFSFLLSLFLYKSRYPRGDGSFGDAKGVFSLFFLPPPLFLFSAFTDQKHFVVVLPFLLFPYFLSHFFPTFFLLLKPAHLPNPSAFTDKLIWSHLGRAPISNTAIGTEIFIIHWILSIGTIWGFYLTFFFHGPICCCCYRCNYDFIDRRMGRVNKYREREV